MNLARCCLSCSASQRVGEQGAAMYAKPYVYVYGSDSGFLSKYILLKKNSLNPKCLVLVGISTGISSEH